MSFYTSLTGINSAISRLDTASNNLANAQTDTFKRSTVTFQDIYSYQPNQLKNSTPGQGASLAAVSQQFSQGALLSTGKTLDVAISGDGFYAMQNKNGERFYSRAGQFDVDESGYVINADGEKLMGAKGLVQPNNSSYLLEPIKIPPKTSGQFKPTSKINIDINLPADDRVIDLPFDPNNDKTYNRKNIVKIYDSMGNPHDATVYYVKKSNPTKENPRTVWETHLYVDGKRVDQPAKEPTFSKNNNYLEWRGDGFSGEKFQWPTVESPSTDDGAISIVGNKLYQGNGLSAKVIGAIDSENDGQNGKPLRINYVEPVKPINKIVQNGVGMLMTSGLKPVGFLPVGSENVKIAIDSYSEDDDIQLFTESGKHLLGTPVIGKEADPTWVKNGIVSAGDVNSEVIKGEYGFAFNANYDGADPVIVSQKNFQYNPDPASAQVVPVKGMNIQYTGDGDRSNNEIVINDGKVEGTMEVVSIDKVTEPVFLMVSGSGVFGVSVSWDKMPDLSPSPIDDEAIKDKIGFIPGSGIEFPIDGGEIIVGDPKSYPGFYLPDGSFIPDFTIDWGPTTGHGGGYKTIEIVQDGKPEGDLSSVDITKDGVVKAYYSNGHSEDLSTLILTRFNNPQGLAQLGDTKYQSTASSGQSIANRAGYGGLGSLQTGAIEQSNVDVTVELVDLIEAQRNFQSNSKAIETVDRMKKAMIDNIS